jgi:hypothetical protein
LLQFRLYKLNQDESIAINTVHLLQKRNDPHQKLTELEFALFPLARLEWGTRYQARINYQHGDKIEEKSWVFTTKKLSYPIFIIEANGNTLSLIPGRTYAVYVPPNDRHPFIEHLSVESPYSVQVDVDWEDKNTLLLKMTGQRCQSVLMQLNGMRSFTASLNRTDNLNRDHRYPKAAIQTCTP